MTYNKRILTSVIVLTFLCSTQVHSSNEIFNSEFLSISPHSKYIDLNRLNGDLTIQPGEYNVDVYVNNEFIGSENITLKLSDIKVNSIEPCFTSEFYDKLPIDKSRLEKILTSVNFDKCILINNALPESSHDIDMELLRLRIDIPQALLVQKPRGYIPSSLLDDGVNSVFLSYLMNGYSSDSDNYSDKSLFSSINTGINVNGWFLRHNGTYSKNESYNSNYQTLDTYIKRDIDSINAKLNVGKKSSSGLIFDSIRFNGIELHSDQSMLPVSLRGYSPVVRGNAKTNAKITIKQNGVILREESVSPGPFVFSDLSTISGSGDLQVYINENDGSVKHYTVPYSEVIDQLRQGTQQFNVMVGELDYVNLNESEKFLEAGYRYGLSNALTGYTGAQVNNNYHAVKIGSAIGTPVGSFSADITHAKTNLENKRTKKGQSYKIAYSKTFLDSGTIFSLASFRFSDDGYMDFQTAAQLREDMRYGKTSNITIPKSRVQIDLTQDLPDGLGSVYTSLYNESYWDSQTKKNKQYQIGYSNSIGDISYYLSAARVYYNEDPETALSLNISVPLGGLLGNSSSLSSSVDYDSAGRSNQRIGVSGVNGDDYQYTYGVSASNDNKGATNISLNSGYTSKFSSLSAGYSYSEQYKSLSLGASGSLVAYKNGIALSPHSGSTFAIIEANGASGAKIGGRSGEYISPWGNGLVTNLNPYDINHINIDPTGLPHDIEIDNTKGAIAPRNGSVSLLRFISSKGYPVLLKINLSSGDDIPFSAEIFDHESNFVGYVGQSNLAYVRVKEPQGKLVLKYTDKVCVMEYKIIDKDSKINHITSICHKMT